LAAFDYVIVGAGSAGCVLADRLTESGAAVALLEAGGSDLHPFIRMPAAFSLPMNRRRFNWFFETQAEEGLAGRRLHCPRGKVLGGSSSINGMVYVRRNTGEEKGRSPSRKAIWLTPSIPPSSKGAPRRDMP
jgi:choline dehydrogenase